MPSIADRLETVRDRICQATHENHRSDSDILLLAVSKKHPASAIAAAHAVGQNHFGENYLQEALDKIGSLSMPELIWHFIGPIQSNKTRAIAENFHWVHTVDRLKIAQRLSNQRPAALAPINLCIQVNIDNELSKSGVTIEEVEELAVAIENLPNIKLRGLMAIPRPNTGDINEGSNAFKKMYDLFNQLKSNNLFSNFDTLSMGMSADLEMAIANGSTIVRIGTDIFGPREK